MRWIKWIVIIVLVLLVAGVSHYTLPQRDIVRIISVDQRREDFGINRIFYANPDSGSTAQPNRDVRYINTSMSDGSIMVYRNEDTGLSWPFYFKFDSADLSARAETLISTEDNPTWVAIRHYGWRFHYWSIYPNATSMKIVDGPEARLIPWFNIIFFIIIGLFGLGLFRLIQRFKRRRIDPVLEDIEDAWDGASDRAGQAGGRLSRFWKKTTGSDK
ncbi:DUF1523 family protein [Amylibacter sp. SFDW26]|uniref:DUF1523 family protein n=1 Tax=Amylibacter sp. SFDW26 TaxID=2652722 RepID=UPI0012618D76|nr:DUF1523 family protein [Amylibacter sp. SFDW26]KAB7613867.1 DUF1523 family protein [Amylibacter sp. SFDW26]